MIEPARFRQLFYKTLSALRIFNNSTKITLPDLENYFIFNCNGIISKKNKCSTIIFENFHENDSLIISMDDAYIKTKNNIVENLLCYDNYFNASLIYTNLPTLQELQEIASFCFVVYEIYIDVR